jgi:hypothetical protein
LTRLTDLANDVASASAAELFNRMPEIAKLSDSGIYERFRQHIETAIVTYLHMEVSALPDCITEVQHRIARRYTRLLTGMKDQGCPDTMYRALAWMLVVYEGERRPKLLTPSAN